VYLENFEEGKGDSSRMPEAKKVQETSPGFQLSLGRHPEHVVVWLGTLQKEGGGAVANEDDLDRVPIWMRQVYAGHGAAQLDPTAAASPRETLDVPAEKEQITAAQLGTGSGGDSPIDGAGGIDEGARASTATAAASLPSSVGLHGNQVNSSGGYWTEVEGTNLE